MGVVIFILVVLLWWFYTSNSESQYEIKKLKNKIENFKTLIEQTSKLTNLPNKRFDYSNNVYLSRGRTSSDLQWIEIKMTLEKVYVKIRLTNVQSKSFSKDLTYTMPINESNTAASIKAEFDYFEKTLLESDPKFYGNQ